MIYDYVLEQLDEGFDELGEEQKKEVASLLSDYNFLELLDVILKVDPYGRATDSMDDSSEKSSWDYLHLSYESHLTNEYNKRVDKNTKRVDGIRFLIDELLDKRHWIEEIELYNTITGRGEVI